MTMTENDRFFKHQKTIQKATFVIRRKDTNTYIPVYQPLTYYFSTFYGKKLAFCFGFLYLCTGNRKNSLLVPKVGHL